MKTHSKRVLVVIRKGLLILKGGYCHYQSIIVLPLICRLNVLYCQNTLQFSMVKYARNQQVFKQIT